ncbi:MAG: hypothetical protein E4H40_01965, partial [Candidatus Brocadiia bacterium]
MSIKKLSKDVFAKFVDSLISSEKVIGVQAKGDRFEFSPLRSAAKLRLDYDVTLQSPRKYFQPPVETLMTFEVLGACKSTIDNEKFIIIGVHPYDMVAINQMDELFSQDNYDVHYMKRRQNAVVIASDVVTPSKNVFASSMGTAVVKDGFDILLTDIGDAYLAEGATDKGKALMAKAVGVVDADDKDLKARQQVWDKNQESLNKHKLNCKPSDLPGLLEKAYT